MKIRIFVSFLLLLAISLSANAVEISQQQAKEKALAFMLKRKGSNVGTLRRSPSSARLSSLISTPTGHEAVFAFNCDGGGFVLVAGDDCLGDVLGYSDAGSFGDADMPTALEALLQTYALQIEMMRSNGTQAAKVSRPHPAIAPLLQTDWYQSAPYNKHLSDTTHATGCVATAMAQVMYYHRWPAGETTEYQPAPDYAVVPPTTFDWDNMLLNYDEQTYTEVQADAVAHLMRWCGLSVKMVYGSQSGASTNEIAPALKGCFGYDKGVHKVSRSDYTIDQWDAMIYAELAAKRPVIYDGMNSRGEGHSFVCDGYDGYGNYAINWGWGGGYNGYYNLAVLDPYGSGIGGSLNNNNRWSVLQDAIIGIQPPTEGTTVAHDGRLSVNELNLVSDTLVMRNADGTFPPIVIDASFDLSSKFKDFAHILYDGTNYIPLGGTVQRLKTLVSMYNTFRSSIELPASLPDGDYRIICGFSTDDAPETLRLSPSNNVRYILLSIKGNEARLKAYPHKQLSVYGKPNFTLQDNLVNQIKVVVINRGDEFNGQLYVVTQDGLAGYENIALKGMSHQEVEFRLMKSIAYDTPIAIFTDCMMHNCIYGQPPKLPTVTGFSFVDSNIDADTHTLQGKVFLGKIQFQGEDLNYLTGESTLSIVNEKKDVQPQENAEEDDMDELNSVGVFSNESLVDGLTPNNIIMQSFGLADKFCFKLSVNDFLGNPIVLYSDTYTWRAKPIAVTTQNQYWLLDDENPVMPEEANVFVGIGCKLKSVTPNKNPNAVYYVDDNGVPGLENSITEDMNRAYTGKGTLTIYDGYEFFTLDGRINSPDLDYIRKFTVEEVGHWTSMHTPQDADVEVFDAVTGEDLTSSFKTYFGQKVSDNYVFSIEPDNENFMEHMYHFFVVPKEFGGRTIRFHSLRFAELTGARYDGAVLPYFGFYSKHFDYAYVLDNDRFELEEDVVTLPFRFYFIINQKEFERLGISIEQVNPIITIDAPGAPVGIKDIVGSDGQVDSRSAAVYNLSGMLISKPEKGVYIKNGKKYVR